MNSLKTEKRVAAIAALVEGSSIRSVERMTGIHRDTIMRLATRLGKACAELMDRDMRDLDCKKIQVDEIWGFVRKKQRQVTEADDPNEVGDVYTFVAIDADTKLIPAYRTGKRDLPTAQAFLDDLAPRLRNRVQLSSDALAAYVDATERAFGADVDYGQIVKSYEAEAIGPGKYSPPKVVSAERRWIAGNPKTKDISTSYIERQNLTMRMHIRRLTRLTNAFSKKVENLKAAVALHFAYYNYVLIHKTLRMTPAMAAGITNRPWTVEDLVKLLD